MSVLTDTDLKRITCFDKAQLSEDKILLIQNGSEDCFTPMGYDLRIGGFYKTFIAKPYLVPLDENKKVEIKPGDIALIGTLENIIMPKDGSISALILSRVSQVSKGLSNISTKVDPGWEGELLIPVQNFSRDTIRLNSKDKLCTIIFFKNESAATLYNTGSSRDKFVRLLAQTRRDSLSKEIILALVSIVVIGTAVGIGYYFFGNSAGFGATVVAGVAIEKAASVIVARIIGKR